jgi:hypothetical protein
MKLHRIAGHAVAAAALFALASVAQALSLTPASPGVIAVDTGSAANCEPDCVYDAFGLTDDGSLTLLYKQDVGGGESGSFAGSYTTEFFNTPDDPADATISFDGGSAIVCGVCYLVIKDGNGPPTYYMIDLTALGWDGEEDIILTGFWPDQGAISHIAIWGTPGDTSVPEPGTLGLLGLGLAGMAAGLRRRRKH